MLRMYTNIQSLPKHLHNNNRRHHHRKPPSPSYWPAFRLGLNSPFFVLEHFQYILMSVCIFPNSEVNFCLCKFHPMDRSPHPSPGDFTNAQYCHLVMQAACTEALASPHLTVLAALFHRSLFLVLIILRHISFQNFCVPY